MRGTLASASRSLCASCRTQRRPSAPLASAAARTYSTTSPTPRIQIQKHARQQQQQHRRSAQHRWLSSQPQPEAAEEARQPQQEQQDESRPGSKRWDHTKRLPYYDLFPESLPQGPPPQGPFDIDVRALRREFLRLQAASHPDYFHSASATSSSSSSDANQTEEAAARRRRQAEAASSHINAAYKTLSHPLLRAQYILAERYGVDLAGDEAGSHGGTASSAADPALLVEVLEAREAIDEAESESDLEAPAAENEERIARCLEGLGRAFAEGDVDGAIGEAVRLRYWESIKEGIRGWEKGVGGGLLHH